MTERDATACPGGFAIPAMAGKEGIVHAQTRVFLAYWEGLRRGQLVPYRSQVDPRYMHCDIGNLFILEGLADGSHRFRVAGSRIIDMFGMELRGLSVRTIMEGASRETLGALIAETLETPAIGYARLCPSAGDGGLWEMLLLPLRSDDGSIDRVIGFMFQLAGGRSIDRLMPLRLSLERRSAEPITRPEAGTGFADQRSPFAGPSPADGAARLTAVEGGSDGRPSGAPRRRPTLRVIGDE